MWVRVLWIIGALLLGLFGRAAWWCVTTWNEPDYFGILPWGDVALGLHSHQGRVSLVEIAPWQADPLYFQAESTWREVLIGSGAALFLYALVLAAVTYFSCRSRKFVVNPPQV